MADPFNTPDAAFNSTGDTFDSAFDAGLTPGVEDALANAADAIPAAGAPVIDPFVVGETTATAIGSAQYNAAPGAAPQAPPAQPVGPGYEATQPYPAHYGPMPSYGPHASAHYGGFQPGYQYPGQPAGHVPNDGFAIASLICSLAAFVAVPFIGSILGIIFGVMAQKRIRANGTRGGGLALAGIIIGAAGIVLSVIGLIAFISIARSGVFEQSYLWWQ